MVMITLNELYTFLQALDQKMTLELKTINERITEVIEIIYDKKFDDRTVKPEAKEEPESIEEKEIKKKKNVPKLPADGKIKPFKSTDISDVQEDFKNLMKMD